MRAIKLENYPPVVPEGVALCIAFKHNRVLDHEWDSFFRNLNQLDSDRMPVEIRNLVREISHVCIEVADRGIISLGPKPCDLQFRNDGTMPEFPEERYWDRAPFNTGSVELLIEKLKELSQSAPAVFDRYAKYIYEWLNEERDREPPKTKKGRKSDPLKTDFS